MSPQKNPFLFFFCLCLGCPLSRRWEGVKTLSHCGEHQESEVKTITSFHLRLIFFPAFFFCDHLEDLCEDFILGIDLESYSYKCRPKGSFLILGLYAGI